MILKGIVSAMLWIKSFLITFIFPTFCVRHVRVLYFLLFKIFFAFFICFLPCYRHKCGNYQVATKSYVYKCVTGAVPCHIVQQTPFSTNGVTRIISFYYCYFNFFKCVVFFFHYYYYMTSTWMSQTRKYNDINHLDSFWFRVANLFSSKSVIPLAMRHAVQPIYWKLKFQLKRLVLSLIMHVGSITNSILLTSSNIFNTILPHGFIIVHF